MILCARPNPCLSRRIAVTLLTGRQRTVSNAWARLKLKSQQSNNFPYLIGGRGAGAECAHCCLRLLRLLVAVVLSCGDVCNPHQKEGNTTFGGGILANYVTGITFIRKPTQHWHVFYQINIFLSTWWSVRSACECQNWACQPLPQVRPLVSSNTSEV